MRNLTIIAKIAYFMSYNSLVVAKNSQRAEELLLQRHLHSEKKKFSLSNSLILGIVCQKIKILAIISSDRVSITAVIDCSLLWCSWKVIWHCFGFLHKFSLWLILKTRVILSINQTQNENQSQLGRPCFPTLLMVWLFLIWALTG